TGVQTCALPICRRLPGMTHDEVRAIALELPEVIEADHHGRPSFRVGAKRAIIATLWDEATLNAMLDEDGVRTAVERWPETCAERYWGKRLAAVAVDLGTASREMVGELIGDD